MLLDWQALATVGFGFGGLILALTNSFAVLSDSRGTRYLDRTRGLVELHELVTRQGSLEGESASAKSKEAHARLLERLDVEARANAVLYLDATARLSKGGSIFAALLFFAYAALLLVFGARLPLEISSQTDLIIAVGVMLVFLTAASILMALGVRQLVRRMGTRRLNGDIGRMDELSPEGLAWIKGLPTSIARRRSERLSSRRINKEQPK